MVNNSVIIEIRNNKKIVVITIQYYILNMVLENDLIDDNDNGMLWPEKCVPHYMWSAEIGRSVDF